jgi:NAD(P)-dependent dehydrogenase (short-subunit alcohol dehydrogenase family)
LASISSEAPTGRSFEATFGVNFIGSAYWIVMVGSEEHRQHVIRRRPLGVPPAGATWRDAMERYGWSKICLNAYAHELRRRWPGHAVYDVCPGPVASEIGREAPPAVARALSFLLRMVFPTPAEAALPVLRLAFDESFAVDRGAPVHHHMSEARPAGGDAADADVGAWVWSETQRLIQSRGPQLGQ